jgi:hypothetical protein
MCFPKILLPDPRDTVIRTLPNEGRATIRLSGLSTRFPIPYDVSFGNIVWQGTGAVQTLMIS